MKKNVFLSGCAAMGMLFAVLFTFSGCPGTDSDPDDEKPQTNLNPAPELPPSGKYSQDTVIEMRSDDSDCDFFYTLDGTVPTKDSARYEIGAKPKMSFVDDVTPLVVKATAIWFNGDTVQKQSNVVEAEYTKWSVVLSDAMKSIQTQVSASSAGGTPANPVTIVILAGTKMEDVEIAIPNPASPFVSVTDGLRQIYEASGGKYFSLDLSKTNWQVSVQDASGNKKEVKGIPGISLSDANANRPNRDKLVSLILPNDIVRIDNGAFNGSTSLKEVNLAGFTKLETIGQYAFSNITGATKIDFTGCTSLVTIDNYGFSRATKLQSLDLSVATSLKRLGDRAFDRLLACEWIELPATLSTISDYAFDHPNYTLKYVRFRSTETPEWGWGSFNYHNGGTNTPGESNIHVGGGFVLTHSHEAIDGEVGEKTNHQFPIYHPNTLGWVHPRGGYFAADDDGYYWISQGVPLKNVGLFDKGSLPSTEDFRGLSTLTINATGISNAHNGKTVTAQVVVPSTANITPATGYNMPTIGNPVLATSTITANSVSFTLATPAGDKLVPLDAETGQMLTYKYNVPRINSQPLINGKPPLSGETWTTSGNSGYYGKPWVANADPSDTTQAKFAILELAVSGGETLEQSGNGSWTDQWGNAAKTYRTVVYVYVDRDVIFHRTRRTKLATVALTLRKGWNKVEKLYGSDPSVIPIAATIPDPIPSGMTLTPAQQAVLELNSNGENKIPNMSMWISGEIQEKPGSTAWNSQDSDSIPWVIKAGQ